MLFKTTIVLPLLLTSLLACGDDSAPAVTADAKSGNGDQTTAINADLKQVSYNVDSINENGYIEVELSEDDVSLLLNLVTATPGAGVLVTEIKNPAGKVIYSASLDEATGDPKEVISDFTSVPFGDAVYLYPTPELTLAAGMYGFSFITEDDVLLSKVNAFIKSSSNAGQIDMQSYQVNLNMWIVHPEAEFNSAEFEQTVQTDFKNSINTILEPHSLSIGTISIFHASAEEVTKYGTINAEDDEHSAGACLAMLAKTTDKLALNLVYAQNLVFSEGSIGGFSTSPGPILNDKAGESCFFANQKAYVAVPENGVTQDLANHMMAGNILHEAGHFMSLPHPTEGNGLVFDYIADTAQCDAATYDGKDNATFEVPGQVDGEISDFECGLAGGAKNFLFYSGIPHYLPFEMSKGQASVLRRHPLFTVVP